VRNYAVQEFSPVGCTDKQLVEAKVEPISKETLAQLNKMFPNFVYRSNKSIATDPGSRCANI
jgi:hypothetical protein